MTGADSFRQAVRHVALSPDFAGAVVRINSPGGTVSASDAMWRVLRKLRKKKPVVVSLGNVAASGGYYTAVGASKILANSATITGISVFLLVKQTYQVFFEIWDHNATLQTW